MCGTMVLRCGAVLFSYRSIPKTSLCVCLFDYDYATVTLRSPPAHAIRVCHVLKEGGGGYVEYSDLSREKFSRLNFMIRYSEGPSSVGIIPLLLLRVG